MKNIFERIPGFLAKFSQIESTTARGKVAIEIIKKDGQTSTAKIRQQSIINFPQADNNKVLATITQKMLDLESAKRDFEECSFRLSSQKGQITRISVINEYEVEEFKND